MSKFTAEAFLFKLCNDRELRTAFSASPESVLDQFPFTSEERAAFLAWDVRALANTGASPMLLMFGFTAIHGMEHGRPEYIRRMKGSLTASANSHEGSSHG